MIGARNYTLNFYGKASVNFIRDESEEFDK